MITTGNVSGMEKRTEGSQKESLDFESLVTKAASCHGLSHPYKDNTVAV